MGKSHIFHVVQDHHIPIDMLKIVVFHSYVDVYPFMAL